MTDNYPKNFDPALYLGADDGPPDDGSLQVTGYNTRRFMTPIKRPLTNAA